jgi:S1-C subfamily serine protease
MLSLADANEIPPEGAVRVYVYENYDDIPDVSGSGAITSSTQVITNWHVVESRREGNTSVQVRFRDGSRNYATVIKQSRSWDVALLQIPETEMEPYKIGPAPKAKDEVQTAGFGYDYEYIAINGTISSAILFPAGYKISDKGLFQVKGAVSRQGDSGGPVTKDGYLVGILFGTSKRLKITEGTSIERIKKMFGNTFQPSYPYCKPACCPSDTHTFKLH